MNSEKRWERDRRCDRQAAKLYERRRDIERLREDQKLMEKTK